MLIEQLFGAALAPLLALARGPRAAEPCAIGSGFFLRKLALRALSELFEIDQFPHLSLRHGDRIGECVQVRVAIAVSKFGGRALDSSILI